MICEQGELIYLDFEPHKGHEPAKWRPAFVVSSDTFNLKSSMTVVCPITSRNNGFPMHVPVDYGDEVTGYICVEQLRAVDLESRKCSHIGYAPTATTEAVLELIGAIFNI